MNRWVMSLGGLSVILGVVVWTLGQEVSSLRESLLKTDHALASCNLERTRTGLGDVNTDGRASELRLVQTPTLPNAKGLNQADANRPEASTGLSASNARIISSKAIGMWKAQQSPAPQTYMSVHVTVDQWFTDIADIEKSFTGGLISEEEANQALRENGAQYQRELQEILGRAEFKPFWNQTRLGDLYPKVPTGD